MEEPARRAPRSRSAAVSGYDPQGDEREHDERAEGDRRDPSTSWYDRALQSSDFGGLKDGVGLVLDAGRAAKVRAHVTTDTPGFTARIQAALAVGSVHVRYSAHEGRQRQRRVHGFDGGAARYYVVWITQLGAHAAVA